VDQLGRGSEASGIAPGSDPLGSIVTLVGILPGALLLAAREYVVRPAGKDHVCHVIGVPVCLFGRDRPHTLVNGMPTV
jgi:hypothetical protein